MKSKLLYFILFLTLYELALMGSGQILKIGPLTLRMLLFIITTFIYLFVVILSGKLEAYFAKLVGVFTILIAIGVIVAKINGNPLPLILEDLKPLIYFYSILFFSLMIKDAQTIQSVNRVMQNSAIILAVVYIALLLGLFTGLIDFKKAYALLDSTGEVFFRGETSFFYKGFLYLCTGMFFFINRITFKNLFIMALLLSAIILTFTRGFLISFVIVAAIYVIVFYHRKMVSLAVVAIGALCVYLYAGTYIDALGDKSESDSFRITQAIQVKDAIDPFSFFVGHGFGKGVAIRPEHMEISYLEIFHKQGVIGLFFWLGILSVLFFLYNKAERSGNKQTALPYLLASIFVFLQSFTNPYLNNPIGMSVIIISLVVLKRLETVNMNIAL